jgi:hypothetical protein
MLSLILPWSLHPRSPGPVAQHWVGFVSTSASRGMLQYRLSALGLHLPAMSIVVTEDMALHDLGVHWFNIPHKSL